MNLSSLLKFYKPNCSYTITAEQELIWQDPTPAPTQEQIKSWELSYQSDIAKQDCKDEAKRRIALTDWSVLPDRSVMLENASDFVTYRTALLNLILSPVDNPTWPTEPTPRWKS